MEAITLCGAVIVIFGLWVEFQPALKAFVKMICTSTLFTQLAFGSEVQKPVYGRKMPICLAKGIGG